ncbi:glycosyltransferase [Frankia sp. AgB1.9]|uniref:glycosyltransferase n=1 Tax=unclassified Frankia TaxID=2632575 RepID=UPI001931DC17|nr:MULTISPECIES: glycosyltransferase [unclassified Frankia]MBL7488626.1 glycosyltransferase [Frankia sp. AgW1.1]MBL7549145.1 glycosyltransferase [Frankia sp. AgB1.9]MBL7619171.1 glycosyltransferase [Frankia sp. AgB1.8]
MTVQPVGVHPLEVASLTKDAPEAPVPALGGTDGGGPAGGWGDRPLATIVIVNWNGAHLLPPCLDAVAKQNTAFGFQTWVVDNASSDHSRALLAERYPWVRVIESPKNLGFAGGNNLALRQVNTTFAVLLNNDAVPQVDWLANLLAPFEQPGGEKLGAVTGKVVFLPRFLRLRLETPTFSPGPHDSRSLGVRISAVTVNGRDVLREVLWERLTFGAEGPPDAPFFWTRGSGELLVPVPDDGPVTLGLTWAAEAPKTVVVSWDGHAGPADGGPGWAAADGGAARFAALPVAGTEPNTVSVTIDATSPRVDVINNVGGIVLRDGYGADRGYQEVDTGQFANPEEVFTACGNGMAMRAALGHDVGWFDDDFFLYYEDTDLSWRIRSRGYSIRYVPGAVLRHVHSASSVEWSPLFVFHTDRNRLLMLTKDATLPLAVSAVARYPMTTASIALRTARQGWAARSRPAVRPTLLRLKVIGSYLRLFPAMVTRRREIGRTASERRRSLQDWLVSR